MTGKGACWFDEHAIFLDEFAQKRRRRLTTGLHSPRLHALEQSYRR